MAVPQYHELFNPTLRALHRLGASAAIGELEDAVAEDLGLSDEDLAKEHEPGRPQFYYRLAWARSYLKKYGLIENSERGVWSLTAKGTDVLQVDPDDVRRTVRAQRSRRKVADAEVDTANETGAEDAAEWRQELLTLLQSLEPAQFEKLCQRVLRESGFTQVEVTGRSGDGGIDGTGTVRLGGLLSFPIIFQCKRYQGSVGPSVVRDFRGAMIGRADRGLILTTGSFSREARKEADRDGAPPVDLVDRDLLLDKLKELQLGVAIQLREEVTIDEEWFRSM